MNRFCYHFTLCLYRNLISSILFAVLLYRIFYGRFLFWCSLLITGIISIYILKPIYFLKSLKSIMQLDQNLFLTKQQQLPKSIFHQDFEAESCTQIEIPSLQDHCFQNYQIHLTIIKEYVLELNPKTKQILSGFKCDFDIKFWILRAPSITSINLGKIQGIAFEFPAEMNSPPILLYLQQDCKQDKMKNLELFTSFLQKKYIVQKQFHEKYKAIKRIGKGVTACVYSALCLLDKSQVAIKSFKKGVYFTQDDGNGKKAFLKQFKILTEIRCKYLSKLLGVYESDNSIYIVQQLLDRTLYNYLQNFSFPQTSLCRRMLYQLLMGLNFLHKKNIMHRDIKLQNMMVRGSNKQNVELVIVDFGLAEYTNTKSEYVYLRCGTPGYVAPQVINISKTDTSEIKYDKSCDIFSLGVIFHILLLGKTVFQGVDLRAVVESNRNCNIDYDFKNYPRITPQIKNILTEMLRKQPKERYTVQQLMNHVFLREQKVLHSNQVYKIQKEHFPQVQVKMICEKESFQSIQK